MTLKKIKTVFIPLILMIILLIISKNSLSFAQTCNEIVWRKITDNGILIDYVADVVIVKSEEENSGIVLKIYKINNTIRMEIIAEGKTHCIDDSSVIEVVFRDSTSLTFKNEKKFNCVGAALIVFDDLNSKELQLLTMKDINSIKVQKMRSEIIVFLSVSQSEFLLKAISCLTQF